MKLTSKIKNSGNWLPLIALPIFLLLCYFLEPYILPIFISMFTSGEHLFSVSRNFFWIIAVGNYLTLFLVHLILFLTLKSFKANLFFVFICLLWLLQMYAHRSGILTRFFPALDSVIERPDIVLMYLPIVAILFISITHKLFPGVLQKQFLYTSAIIMGIFVIASLVFRQSMLYYTVLIAFAGISAIAAIYIIIRLITKWRTFKPEQPVFLCGFLIFLHGAIYDVLLSGDTLPLILQSLNLHYTLIFSMFTSASLIIATSRLLLESNTDTARRAAQQLITENQLDFQREQFGRLMENVESAKFMRHDMKHHLAVINEYVQSENISAVKGYLEGMELGLNTSKSKFYCENYAVNAIVNHYIAFAENDGIKTTIKLNVPANAGQIKESDLCVIVGNLLENAVEACRNLPKAERFIRLFSYVQDDFLTFTMENSFDGDVKAWGGLFYSTKRDGGGIGLSSVQAVAERYGGDARFEAKEAVFLSSVYVEMAESD